MDEIIGDLLIELIFAAAILITVVGAILVIVIAGSIALVILLNKKYRETGNKIYRYFAIMFVVVFILAVIYAFMFLCNITGIGPHF